MDQSHFNVQRFTATHLVVRDEVRLFLSAEKACGPSAPQAPQTMPNLTISMPRLQRWFSTTAALSVLNQFFYSST